MISALTSHLSAAILLFLSVVSAAALPVITGFTDRTAFENSVGAGRLTEDFSSPSLLFPVTTARGAVAGGKWLDVARGTGTSTAWGIPFGTKGWGATWDLTVDGVGGGIAFELDFGGGNIVAVPGHLAPGSPAGQFFGFTADEPFFGVRVRVFDSQGGTLQETHTVDDLTVQTSPGGGIAIHDGPTAAAAEITDGQSTPVDFGMVARNTPVSRTMTIANTTDEPLQVFGFRTSGNFQITNAPALPFTVAAGGNANFSVTFLSGSGGLFASRVDVLNSDIIRSRFNFDVTASVQVDTEIQIINTQNGAEVISGQSGAVRIAPNSFGGGSAVSVELRNTGLDPLIISGVSLPPGFSFTIGGFTTLPRSIPPGQSLFLTISSTGPAPGFYSGSVVLTTSDADEGTFTFPVEALYDMPEIQVLQNFSTDVTTGATVDFGTTPLGRRKIIPLTVRNLHGGVLTVSGVTLPAGCALASTAPAFPFSLSRNQTREIPVELTAQTPGAFSGVCTILNNDFDESPFTLQFTGDVLTDSITFFGLNTIITEGFSVSAFASGAGPVQYAWDLDGDGQFDDATGSNLSLPDSDGPGSFTASVRMTDNLTSMIRTQNIPVENRTPFPGGSLPESVIAGESVTLTVSANDAAADLAAGMTWRIDWGDGTIDTTPSGSAPDMVFHHVFTGPGAASIGVQVTDKDGATGSTNFSLWIHSAVFGVFDGPDAGGPELRDGVETLFFSAPAGGSQDRMLTVLNRSSNPQSIGPFTLPGAFALVAPPVLPAALAPGASLTLQLRFAPAAGGSYGGPAALTLSDPAMPAFNLELSGEGQAPGISVSEFSGERFDFASGEESFRISPGTQAFFGTSFHIESNNFEAPLMIQSIELPPGFQFENPPVFPLDFTSDSSVDLRLQCRDAVPGFYKGWVSIHSNDPDDAPFRFFVSSRVGDVADLQVKSSGSGSSSAEGLILNGQDEAVVFPLQLRLRNGGNQPLTVSTVTLPAGFAFAAPPVLPVVLSSSGSATLPEILFTATAPGDYSGSIVITSTDPDENPFGFMVRASIAPPEPAGLDFNGFTIKPAQAAAGAAFSGGISGPPHATVVIEGNSDPGDAGGWVEAARVTLDASGLATLDQIPLPDTGGRRRFFLRMRLPAP